MNTAQEPPSTKRARRVLASLLVVGSILFGGTGTGVAATTGTSPAPVSAAAVADDGTESKLDASTRQRAARRVNPRAADDDVDPLSGRASTIERLLVRWLRLAPPSWRGPPVLLM